MQLECGEEIWRYKTRITRLPYGEEIVIVGRPCGHECDRQTDRQADIFTMTLLKIALCIASRDKKGTLFMAHSVFSIYTQLYCILLQIVFVGMLIGSNVWGSFSDKHGRRLVSEFCSIGSWY